MKLVDSKHVKITVRYTTRREFWKSLAVVVGVIVFIWWWHL